MENSLGDKQNHILGGVKPHKCKTKLLCCYCHFIQFSFALPSHLDMIQHIFHSHSSADYSSPQRFDASTNLETLKYCINTNLTAHLFLAP